MSYTPASITEKGLHNHICEQYGLIVGTKVYEELVRQFAAQSSNRAIARYLFRNHISPTEIHYNTISKWRMVHEFETRGA